MSVGWAMVQVGEWKRIERKMCIEEDCRDKDPNSRNVKDCRSIMSDTESDTDKKHMKERLRMS